jgi:hypothetical protein
MDDIRSLIPRGKHDHERADAVIEAGYPAVGPILPELLEWVQDMNWPVAMKLAPFLASIGAPLAPHIREVFKTDDETWKCWIIGEILQESPELAGMFRDELERIAYSPNESEAEYELNENAKYTLRRYGWQKTEIAS